MQPIRSALAALRARFAERWLAQPEGLRNQVRVVLAVAVPLYTVHTLAFCWPQPWFIEDSAISFAYARHLVEGHGLVTYPGGERVEGYSNALWTLLVALFYAVRLEPWVSTKLMGWAFGVVAMFGSLGLARRAAPALRDHPVMVAAPLLLAASTQFTLWNASGLENSLFCALLAVGAWRVCVEVEDDDATPWSALAFVGLTMTRPDGIAYAGIAGFARACGTVARRQWRAGLLWLLALALPWAAYNAWRYSYFAWTWPNTYYAKAKEFDPLNWTSGGWKYLRDFGWKYGVAWATPVVLAGAVGLRGGRRWLVLAASVLLAVVLLWDGAQLGVVPTTWTKVRVGSIVAVLAGTGLATFGAPGWLARGQLWASLAIGLFFAVWANGDWMKGFRWFSLTSVPMFTLVAAGLAGVAAQVSERFAATADAVSDAPRVPWYRPTRARAGTVVAVLLAVALASPNTWKTSEFLQDPETAPRDVRKRVNYMKWVQSRLGLDHVTLLDVDMGAHLWYTDWDIVDLAGLVDVPIARHNWEKPFAREYIFEERRPDFAHVHGGWAKTSKLAQHPQWNEQYVEIPGFPSGKTAFHIGNHVRRDHLVGTAWSGPSNGEVRFAGGVTLAAWHVPSPEVAPGGELTVNTAWRLEGGRTAGFRVLLVLTRGGEARMHAMEVAPAYDWLHPSKWRAGELGWGRWSVAIPKDMPMGTWDLAFVVLDEETGAVLGTLPPEEGGLQGAPPPAVQRAGQPANVYLDTDTPAPARYAQGEWVAPAAVRLVSAREARAKADGDLVQAEALAAAGDCEGARRQVRDATRHVALDEGFARDADTRTNPAVVACWIARAEASRDPLERARLLVHARAVDHEDPALTVRVGPLAQELEARGDASVATRDWAAAYEAYALSVAVDPRRSVARRKAEAARDARLKLPTKGQPSLTGAG